MANEMYVAKQTFFAVLDGKLEIVNKDRDLVSAGHKLLRLYPDKFKPASVRFDVEQATAAPGERRGEPTSPDSDFPRYAGGGWYVTPDGERFRGRDAAVEHMDTPPAA